MPPTQQAPASLNPLTYRKQENKELPNTPGQVQVGSVTIILRKRNLVLSKGKGSRVPVLWMFLEDNLLERFWVDFCVTVYSLKRWHAVLKVLDVILQECEGVGVLGHLPGTGVATLVLKEALELPLVVMLNQAWLPASILFPGPQSNNQLVSFSLQALQGDSGCISLSKDFQKSGSPRPGPVSVRSDFPEHDFPDLCLKKKKSVSGAASDSSG